ncbi:class I SAM-dependent methyltransferase [Candidatus Woesearchaeota archaeon]|nr:class I SAM-dependent methyltransferase [Candidatus Woesearchaeota archaeon]
MRLLRKLYYGFYRKIFPDYPVELEKAVGDCKTLLDVGCGSNSPVKLFQHRLYSVGVDAFKPSVEKAKGEKTHNKYYVMDVLEIGKAFKPGSFDCVLASDVIEHLAKEDGYKLLDMMEKIARRKVIIFTPNGFMPQAAYEGNPWQLHKSGWAVNEMRKRGYKVTGVNGFKPLRWGGCEGKFGEEFTSIRLKPKYFWLVVSDLTQLFLRKHPERAFQILCVKTMSAKPKAGRVS